MRTRLCFLASLAAVALSQTVRLEPNIAVAESDYRDAQDLWLRNDPNLMNELFSGNKEEIHRRVRRAATLRDDVMAKKDVYLGFIIARLDETRKRLTDVSGSRLPIAELTKGLEQEQSRILGDQERLESLMNDLPQGDEFSLVRRELEKEKDDLIKLQNTVAMRTHSLENAGKAQQATQEMAASNDAVLGKLDTLQKLWEEERTKTVSARASWAQLYLAIDKEVDKKGDSKPSGRPAKTAPAPKAKDKPGESQASDRFTGSWIYKSQPGAWIGYGEPASVAFNLAAAGNELEGDYVARLPGRGDFRALNLHVKGRQSNSFQAQLEWTSEQPPAHGAIRLHLGRDGRMLLERLNSDDSYIPRGMEVLSPKQ